MNPVDRPAIEIEGLGKRYAISHVHRPDSLKAWLRGRFLQRISQRAMDRDEDFWALQDINLRIGRGECVALVGSNGSGKSTLLKILSRIIPPTCGLVRIRGRVASLLEVGTGFHPELTGRENVFLNGAMLGCPEREIRRRFDEIVDFSGVERFLDTPVKHYSSGMYVRLAYAIAAHVDAEILLVDEVLAVGDADFRERCITNIAALRRRNVTILFVSHDADLIDRLECRTIKLCDGRIAFG